MDMKNLQVAQFTENYGNVRIEQVAIFNQTTATDEDLQNAVHTPNMYHENVIIISKLQYENVFGPVPTADEDEPDTNEGANLQ